MADRETLLQSALDLAARGFRVFPLRPGAKKPALEGWQDKATSDEEVIRAWWSRKDYNVGVKTGDGLVVVDIDVKNGKPGVASFKALGLTKDEMSTFRVRTASGGWHVYYRGDGDVRNSADALGLGLDVRAAGGYVVGPGSVLTNGSGQGSYEITADAAPVLLPESIAERLASRSHVLPERSVQPAVDLDQPDALERAAAWLRSEAPFAVEGQHGDQTTFTVAARLKDFGVSAPSALDLLLDWNERCSPPWNLDDLQEKVRNAYAYGTNQPGSDHPRAVFGGVHLEPLPPRVQSRWYRHGDAWSRDAGWLYYEVLPRTGVAVIVGAPQSGKTFVELELARSLATGKAFFGVVPDELGGVVFLFAGTEGSGLPLRLAALAEQRGLPISATPVSDLSERGALGALLTDIREEAARMLETFGVPLRLVVLETLSASGLLVNENDNSEISRALANLGTLSRELDCLVVTTHHPPKNGAGERGGSAIRGSADYILEIEREERELVRRLNITKARDAEQRQLGTFTLNRVDLGKDERGRPITSMTISMGEPMARKGRRADGADVMMQALEMCLAGVTEVVEGHHAAEFTEVRTIFKGLGGGGGRSDSAFKKCVDYALDVGAIGQAMWAGERYLWIKERDDD